MTEKLYILFCESPLQPNKVDEDYEDEYIAAKNAGFETLFVNYENLVSHDMFLMVTKRIKRSEQLAKIIYRGWMLTPKQYFILYDDLIAKNYQLVNTVEEYRNCHYLPDSLQFIEVHTPKTIFEKFDDESSIDRLVEKAKVFGENAVILKDYVKSEKHDWDTACYVKDASDSGDLRRSINNLISLRGQYLNEGIVLREFVKLNHLTTHSKSGMPLTEEYRLFFCKKKLIGIYDYWEEGEYKLAKPATVEFETIAKGVNSNFFTMEYCAATQWCFHNYRTWRWAGSRPSRQNK